MNNTINAETSQAFSVPRDQERLLRAIEKHFNPKGPDHAAHLSPWQWDLKYLYSWGSPAHGVVGSGDDRTAVGDRVEERCRTNKNIPFKSTFHQECQDKARAGWKTITLSPHSKTRLVKRADERERQREYYAQWNGWRHDCSRARLADATARLEALGKPYSTRALAREAHSSWRVAKGFRQNATGVCNRVNNSSSTSTGIEQSRLVLTCSKTPVAPQSASTYEHVDNYTAEEERYDNVAGREKGADSTVLRVRQEAPCAVDGHGDADSSGSARDAGVATGGSAIHRGGVSRTLPGLSETFSGGNGRQASGAASRGMVLARADRMLRDLDKGHGAVSRASERGNTVGNRISPVLQEGQVNYVAQTTKQSEQRGTMEGARDVFSAPGRTPGLHQRPANCTDGTAERIYNPQNGEGIKDRSAELSEAFAAIANKKALEPRRNLAPYSPKMAMPEVTNPEAKAFCQPASQPVPFVRPGARILAPRISAADIRAAMEQSDDFGHD